MIAPKYQRLCAWSGSAAMLLFFAGFLVAGFIPLPSPNIPQDQVLALYLDRPNAAHLGILITQWAAALFVPFAVSIFILLKRCEGGHAPLAYIELAWGALLSLLFIVPLQILQVAGYRDRTPEAVQSLHDAGWILFIGISSGPVLQIIVTGLAILMDQRAEPICPRWVGYLCFWVALLASPGCLCVFFQTGPLAWNGIFTFWIPAIAFVAWIAAMTKVILKDIKTQELEASEHHQSTLTPEAAR